MPNLQGTSLIGHEDGGHLYEAQAIGSKGARSSDVAGRANSSEREWALVVANQRLVRDGKERSMA